MKNTNKYERVAMINLDTGEVLSETVVKNNEEIKITTTKKTTEKQRQAYFKRKIVEAQMKIEADAMRLEGKQYDGFVLMYYVKDQLLLKGTGLDFKDISRTLYLGTHLGYNEKTGNMLVVKRNQRVIEPMTRTDMMTILGLSESTLKRFLKNAKASGVLIEEDKKFYLSEEYFTKGTPRKKTEYTRLYVKPIRNMFEGTKTTEHKQVGIILSLIPFLNYDLNYLENSDGTPMNLQQLNELLEYDESHASRLFKQLRALKVEFGGKFHHIITQMVLNEASDEREEKIYINPMIVYRGKSAYMQQEVIKQMLFNTSNTINKAKERKKQSA